MRTTQPLALLFSCLGVLGVLSGKLPAAAQDPAPAGEAAAPAVGAAPLLDGALAHLVHALSLPGAGFAVGHKDRLLHVGTRGDFAEDQALPIASASKWLCVATILSLVDDGTLDLDLPIARYLAEFEGKDTGHVTLRQCLSCTSGLPPVPPALRGRDSMDAMAAALADSGLRTTPGSEFRYGGGGFQAAACAAVRRTGSDWHVLFRARIATPLGLQATAFGRVSPLGDEAGTAAVPWVAGGAVSTLRDYERFVRMLASGGEFEGVRVLQPKSIDAMFQSCTRDLKVRFDGVDGVEGFDGDLAYGLGTWLHELPEGGARGSDPGALGFLPWVDRDQGIYGVLAVQDRIARVLPRAPALQQAARAFVASPAVSGRDEVLHLEHGGRDRRYLLHTPPGAERSKAMPLLVVLHGGGGTGAQVAESTGFSPLADREGFVVVYPDGTGPIRGRLLTWNSGGIPVYAVHERVDDVAFLKAVVADVGKRVAIDPERVCATGMSNGGMMCHRLAREAADVFAAIAPVSGAMNFTSADDATEIAMMIVHGTADRHVRYEGGRPERSVGRAGDRTDASVADAVTYYRARNGLAGEPQVDVDGKVRIESWAREKDGAPMPKLVVVTLDGGGHSWPGARVPGAADASFAWDASAAIWAFCKDARRQPHR